MKLRNKKSGEIITLKDEGELALLKLIEDSLPNGLNVWKEVKEPLIKDEKVRKAVRAWAEAQELTEVYLASNGYEIYGGIDDWVMQFKGEPFPFADKKEIYTIAELCGEEEECES